MIVLKLIRKDKIDFNVWNQIRSEIIVSIFYQSFYFVVKMSEVRKKLHPICSESESKDSQSNSETCLSTNLYTQNPLRLRKKILNLKKLGRNLNISKADPTPKEIVECSSPFRIRDHLCLATDFASIKIFFITFFNTLLWTILQEHEANFCSKSKNNPSFRWRTKS